MSISPRRCRILVAAATLVVLVIGGATPVLAHADLVSADPADGARLATPPTTITLTFSEGVVAKQSSFNLILSGQILGTGKAAADGDTTMTLGGLSLGPGDYAIQWTSVAEDGDLLRGTVTFTILAPTSTPASPTPTPSVQGTDDVSSNPPSAAAVTPTPQASADAAPVSSSGTDVLLPIVVGLLVVAGVGAFLLRRTRRA